MEKKGSDLWYATHAVQLYRRLGWDDDSDERDRAVVKLVHTRGRDSFAKHGVVFIDGPFDEDHYMRLCVLFPGQRMGLHHHEKRSEVFKIVEGTMRALVEKEGDEEGSCFLVPVGGYISPGIGEKHAVSTDATGCAYVGVCHKEHMTDVHWEPDARIVDAPNRVTVVDLPRELPLVDEMPEPWRSFRTDKTIAAHLRDAFAESIRINQSI